MMTFHQYANIVLNYIEDAAYEACYDLEYPNDSRTLETELDATPNSFYIYELREDTYIIEHKLAAVYCKYTEALSRYLHHKKRCRLL